ncbi:unnamed protein product [Trifolium pratense]|uniref:Uncharacterized protein n=1 Tax=Trifolium pratense TaxID=57577 RepID=A0ACB0L202_TRIPR|nr:unnamed protein product [Trifolium pratense]
MRIIFAPLLGKSEEVMHEKCLKRKNPWLREHPDEYFTPRHYRKISSGKLPKFEDHDDNVFLDIHTKRAVLEVSSSIVALLSYTTGEQELFQSSGVIIENDGNNGHIVLTSANLIRRPTEEDIMENKLADNLKVMIYLYDGRSYEGEVCAYDFHYNIAWIRFKSDSSLATATLRQVDDYINVNPAEEKSFHLRPPSSHFNLVPGHAIVAVGRYFAKPFDLMAAPGEFILGRCDFDCEEVFTGTCKTTRCGEGGALINMSGEVIGITFYYDFGFPTPFLPINIAHKCWEHYKRYGGIWRPSLGFKATNLYTADIYVIEKVIQKIPSICNGVLVEKVIQGSSADSAGLRLKDVIVQCGGKTVRSFLEFLEMVLDKKVGDVLQLSVFRPYQNDPVDVNMVVDEVAVEKFNRWPHNR